MLVTFLNMAIKKLLLIQFSKTPLVEIVMPSPMFNLIMSKFEASGSMQFLFRIFTTITAL